MARHRPIFYYVMNNECVEEHNAFFERPSKGMKSHLKALFIRGKVENMLKIKYWSMVGWQ